MSHEADDDSFGWNTELDDDLMFHSFGSCNTQNNSFNHEPGCGADDRELDVESDSVLDNGPNDGEFPKVDTESRAAYTGLNKQSQCLETVGHEESKTNQGGSPTGPATLTDVNHEDQEDHSIGSEKECRTLQSTLEKTEDPKTNSAKETQFVFKFSRFANGKTGARNRWWTHELYRGPDGAPAAVHYSRTLLDSEVLAKRFLEEPILGFDMEWLVQKYGCRHKACREVHTHYLQQKISLIQIASESQIGLFHIALHKGSKVEDVMAPTLRKIIESRDVIKTGVGIDYADAKRLNRFFNIKPQGLIDLNDLHSLVNKSFEKSKVKLKFATLVHMHLGIPLNKDQSTRCSNWSKTLNSDQITYAAADAYAGFVLFQVLDNKRKRLKPVPPRPEFAETTKASTRGRGAATKAGTNVSNPSLIQRTGVAGVNEANQAIYSDTRKDLYDLRKNIHQNILELCPQKIESIATDETVDLLASIRPSSVQELSKVAGAVRFSKCASQWDLDLLEVLQRARLVESTSQKENVQPSQQRSFKRKAGPVHRRSPSSEDAFEVRKAPLGQHLKERSMNSTTRDKHVERIDLTADDNSVRL